MLWFFIHLFSPDILDSVAREALIEVPVYHSTERYKEDSRIFIAEAAVDDRFLRDHRAFRDIESVLFFCSNPIDGKAGPEDRPATEFSCGFSPIKYSEPESPVCQNVSHPKCFAMLAFGNRQRL
jgi:hypothetical protein